ncbi:MAG: carbohydrate kinase family protein [Epsilonproteobacteria bacterium]|nr:carbohydrate kinase family protein [Campylobacterota bacterium]
MKVLTIGGATRDLFLECEGTDIMTISRETERRHYMLFESGQKIEVDNIAYHTGGGGTNSAVSFARLGFDVAAFCCLGNDYDGKKITQTLEEENVSSEFICISDQYTTGRSFIINSQQGERTIFAHRGANSFLKLSDIPKDYLKECTQLYITSLSNESAKLLPEICTFAKQHNVPIAINPGTSQLKYGLFTLKDSLTNIDILIMNGVEAKLFMLALTETDNSYKQALESSHPRPSSYSDQNRNEPYLVTQPLLYEDFCFSTHKFFKQVMNFGPKIVVITNGCNGVYVAAEKTVFFCPSLEIDVVDSVGAGDSFGSAFVASLMYKQSIEDALRAGIANSASVLSQLGAKTGLLTKDELQQATQKLPKQKVQTFDL